MPFPFPKLRRTLPLALAISWSAVHAAENPVEPILPDALPLLAQAGAIANEPRLDAPAPAPVAEKSVPSQSLTINLIKRMVAKGLLSQEEAADLIKEAEAETSIARTQAIVQQQEAIKIAVADAVAQAQGDTFQPDPALLPQGDDTVRVTYIPENVKAEMREQIKHDVMAQARDERWAAPRLMPEWALKIKLFGDVRVRYEGDFFPNGNDNTGAFPNFNAINTGAPFDIAGTNFSPQLNVDQDRNRVRLRVRLGLEADLGNGFSAGLRIGTGETNTPTSTNQTLGAANNGQGGNFSKYAIWLDRGFLKYELGATPSKNLSLTIGRFDNPFFRASEIVWDEDVGFDGFALAGQYEVAKGVTPYVVAGAFPVFNTDFNFASTQPSKFKSTDKWLYGGQLGANWKIRKDLNFKFGSALYYFDNVEGQLSDPFIPLSASDQGNTDNTRNTFAQKGNTYRPLRRITPSPLNNFGTTNQFQYFGLATPFHELHLAGKLDYTRWEPITLSLYGEYVKNLAFDASAIDAIAVNNRGPNSTSGNLGRFSGGDTAWIVGLNAGDPLLSKKWAWQVGVNYRYVESDAVVDAFTDSDFGLGGTNLKGYTIFGALALSPNINVRLRWMSSDEVTGPPLKVDTILFDVSGKF
jgi:hypothetical protein